MTTNQQYLVIGMSVRVGVRVHECKDTYTIVRMGGT